MSDEIKKVTAFDDGVAQYFGADVGNKLQKNSAVLILNVGIPEASLPYFINMPEDGVIMSLDFYDGQGKNKGDVLFTYKPQPYKPKNIDASAEKPTDKSST